MSMTPAEKLELKEKLKSAILRRLDPQCESDRALINSEDISKLLYVLLNI